MNYLLSAQNTFKVYDGILSKKERDGSKMKIAVIGAGISGLSVSRMLADKHQVIIFEKKEKPGGLIKCERVQDCLFHKVGGHVFNSKNPKVLDWFWKHLNRETEFIQAKRNAKIFFNNQVIGYPIENFIYQLDKSLIKKIFSELIKLQSVPKLPPLEYDNFESFLRNNFGNTLFQIYFEPYNRKIWQTDLSKVPMEWLEGKLPMPNIEHVIISNIIRQEEDGMVHSTFYYAKDGGSQFIADRLSAGLEIRIGEEIKEAIKEKKQFSIGGEEGFDKIVYCGDIRTIPPSWKNLLVSKGVDVTYIEGLRSNGTSNLFCETDETDVSWLYIPEPFTKAHRIIYTGNFSTTNNRGSSRKTCVVEFSGEVDYDTMTEEIKKLPGNLTPLSFNYEPNSYVIQDKRTRLEIAAGKRALEEEGIYLLGRFAEWEYYNMDKCIESAFEVCEKLG